jgi:PAS domain S-box-containing protein
MLVIMDVGRLLIWTLVFFSLGNGMATAAQEYRGGGTVLTAERISEPILIDGFAEEASWDTANPLTVRAKYGGIGTVDVEVKALYDAEYIYIYARWQDAAENASKGIWTYNATTGRWTTSENEDRIAFMWNINDSIRGFNIAGCIITCHGDRKHTEHPDEEADIWHWKASRTNPAGYCDDQFLNNTLSPTGGSEDKVVARYGDDKTGGGYVRNINPEKTTPRYYEPAPDDKRDAQFLLKAEIDDGEVVEITGRTVFEDGTTVPGYILERPTGSRGDIDAAGVWRDGYWGVEFKRRLLTGHPHDVQFDTGKLYRFGIAVMDNEGGFESHGHGHSFEMDAKTLEFGGLGSYEVAYMGLVRDYLTTAKVYAGRGDGGLAASEINYALALFDDIRDETSSVDPELYIRMKDRFTQAKRVPSVENINALIEDADLMILTLQGKRVPPKATLVQRFLVVWGQVQPYFFIFLAALVLYPIYRTVQTGRKPVFRKMSVFLFLVMAPVLLEGLGRLGMVLGIPFLYTFSFMTSEYATLLWALLMFIAIFFARAGFGEVDRSIRTLKERKADLVEAVEQLQMEIAERIGAEERYRTFLQNFQGIAYRASLDFEPIFFHGAVEEVTGYTEADFLDGKPRWDQVVHPDDFSYIIEIPSKAIREVPNYSGERVYRIIRKDGEIRWVQEFIQNVCDDSGKPHLVQGAIYDITKRKEAEEALKESEEKFRTLFEDSRDAVYITSREGRLVDFNEATLELFGYTRDEMKDLNVIELYQNPEDRRRFQEEIEEKGSVRDYEVKFKKKDGTEMDCLVTSSLRRAEDGSISGYQGIIRDITEQKRSEEALRRSKEFIETALNSMNDAVSIINVNDFTIVGVNRVFLDQLGLTEDEVMGKPCFEITHHRHDPCGSPDDVCPLMETLRTGKHAVEEHVHYQKDGRKVFVEVSTSPIKEGGKVVQVVHVARDVTARKKAEEQIRASLREKEVLLKEIHHRVKNNMQVISSLLKLQSRYATDERHLAMFRESQNQIKSMVLVHELLYQSKDLANIDFKEYLKDVVNGLIRSFGVDKERIAFNVDVEGVSLSIDSAVPCGLIINELISNSIKYAFPDGRKGEIRIGLHLDGEKFVLTYSDNGIGLPGDIDFKNTETLGMRLIKALVDELDGEIEVERTEGTTFKIEFSELRE